MNRSMSQYECSQQYWDEMWSKEKRKGFTDEFFERFKNYIKGKVLDLGGGYTSAYEKYRICPITEYYNLDFSIIALKKSKTDYPEIHVVQVDLNKGFRCEKEYFDTILAVQILEHLPLNTLVRLQIQLYEILKEKGNLLVEIPLHLPHKEHKIVFDSVEDVMFIFKDWQLMESIHVKENVDNLILRLNKHG